MLETALSVIGGLTIAFWIVCGLAITAAARFWTSLGAFVKVVHILTPIVTTAAVLRVLYYYGVEDTTNFFFALFITFMIGFNVLTVARVSAGIVTERS